MCMGRSSSNDYRSRWVQIPLWLMRWHRGLGLAALGIALLAAGGPGCRKAMRELSVDPVSPLDTVAAARRWPFRVAARAAARDFYLGTPVGVTLSILRDSGEDAYRGTRYQWRFRPLPGLRVYDGPGGGAELPAEYWQDAQPGPGGVQLWVDAEHPGDLTLRLEVRDSHGTTRRCDVPLAGVRERWPYRAELSAPYGTLPAGCGMPITLGIAQTDPRKDYGGTTYRYMLPRAPGHLELYADADRRTRVTPGVYRALAPPLTLYLWNPGPAAAARGEIALRVLDSHDTVPAECALGVGLMDAPPLGFEILYERAKFNLISRHLYEFGLRLGRTQQHPLLPKGPHRVRVQFMSSRRRDRFNFEDRECDLHDDDRILSGILLLNGITPQETTPIAGEWNFNAQDGDEIKFYLLFHLWCTRPTLYLLVRVEVWDAHDGRRYEQIMWMENKP